MPDVPEAIPETIPVVDPTVAAAVLLLLQVPPVVASLKVTVDPAQTLPETVIADIGLTVTVCIAVHPVVAVYVIFEVPLAIPVTTPEAEPTVA